ncbi:transmembrane protein 41B isoform X2 [Chrysoperla carnea]|uniref:transmembrane protein 41B isoform X2 n=1 Tax=Chrysoperla carnea TaxID=189513 RepID=UPI001D092F19|nr:transmembrane protein 41B isoform X2 [Chrysoperla carnea]
MPRSHQQSVSAERPEEEVLGSTRGAIVSVLIIFLCSILALMYVYTNFPNLEEHEKQHIKIPWDITDAKNLGIVLSRYKDKYYFEVLSGVCVTYIFLQTFAIPGSLFLSILSGFLFPFFVALVLVCSCSAIGASLCYLLSQLLGRRIVFRYFPDRARAWSQTVHKHKNNLLNYMLFLRITPFVPNWFINLTAPVIGVPLYPFVMGTFLGVAPPSFVAIQAGQTLQNITSSNDTFSWTSVILLTVFAVLSMIPVLLRDRFKNKFE